jgi:hypothetical protein
MQQTSSVLINEPQGEPENIGWTVQPKAVVLVGQEA